MSQSVDNSEISRRRAHSTSSTRHGKKRRSRPALPPLDTQGNYWGRTEEDGAPTSAPAWEGISKRPSVGRTHTSPFLATRDYGEGFKSTGRKRGVRPKSLHAPFHPSSPTSPSRPLRQSMDDIIGAKLERRKSVKSGKASISRISTLYSTSRASTEGRRPEEIYEVQFQWPEDHPTEMATVRTYPSNYIRTTKYTFWSFLPVNLFNQFRRFYNIYFLLAAIFVLVEPGLDPTSEIMPLCIVLVITAIKDGHEDYKRYRSDKAANQEVFHRLSPQGKLEDIPSRDIRAGDIMIIRKGERIPADLMILGSSGEDGVCYVDTVELDGETSLKRRMAVPLGDKVRMSLGLGGETEGDEKKEGTDPESKEGEGEEEEAEEEVRLGKDGLNPKIISRIYGHIECELPNERLNAFEGIVTLYARSKDGKPSPESSRSTDKKEMSTVPELLDGQEEQDSPTCSSGDIHPLGMDSLLLRGTFLRNTRIVYGVVIYAGSDTKIFK